MAYCGDREVSDEAVAEAFAQALRRGGDLRDPAAWVWRVAFKVASGEMKSRRETDHSVPDLADPSEQPAFALIDVLRHLPTNQRAAVVMHYYADLPVAEVASRLGVSSATARVHLHRGRKRLRELLEDDDD
jgi:RNA polymerase sigma-70 factor (ECF subfamily)